jgi:hypothetical protein
MAKEKFSGERVYYFGLSEALGEGQGLGAGG